MRKFLLILTVVLFIILATVAWFFPSDEDFRVDNPFWNGAQDISSSIPVSPLSSLSDLPSPPAGSALVLIPYLDFTPTELDELRNFVTRGGTLVLADDYGFGNQVLEHLELKVRFSGHALLDPLLCYKNKGYPRISHFTPGPLNSNARSLVLNHATSLTNVAPGDILALSSSASFLDLNDNEFWDEGEPDGPLPVISQHTQDNGRIILISDPSIFINSMQDIESNNILMQNIITITKSELLIDQSHLLPPSTLHQTKTLLASIRNSFTNPIGTAGLVILALTITLMPIWYNKEEKGEDIDHRAE
ncbi:DUF4350 domain-containing protein [Chloroflexota bacterium]